MCALILHNAEPYVLVLCLCDFRYKKNKQSIFCVLLDLDHLTVIDPFMVYFWQHCEEIMSKYPCDNWSWSSRRRGDPRLRDHDANKENREPISPLSRLAEKVDDSRRWAPIPDRWHNHCEWLVNHHRNLRKRFRRTTANDRLAGVLTTLQCTQERRRGSDEDESVVGRGSRCKRSR